MRTRLRQPQQMYFQLQIELAKLAQLPMIVRCRNAYDDIIPILGWEHEHIPNGGIILGFDGSDDQARRLQRMDFKIGISGCSLKTKEQREVVRTIPHQSLILMSDSPNCEINITDFGTSRFLKTTFSSEPKSQWTPGKRVSGRNEPGNIIQVLEVAAALKNISLDYIAYLSNKSLPLTSH
ncbi:deoxyribonuclease TATDN1-like isoform X2 [Macrosteles quadrilineatus]|uniref:deoxyribonuclease TATDN1-like isoform X2 n=1 Tax=Macrosteles quadrilineatus TaxID=74068 RepID=UPI0023E09FAE|nr:deoxyribonuclease TATDN1-like isoform X2 [Macrosteles quadrilineatus]